MGMQMIKIQGIMGKAKQSEKRHNPTLWIKTDNHLLHPLATSSFFLKFRKGSLNSSWGPWVPLLTRPAVILDDVFLSDLCYPFALNEIFLLLWSLCSPLFLNKMPRTGEHLAQPLTTGNKAIDITRPELRCLVSKSGTKERALLWPPCLLSMLEPQGNWNTNKTNPRTRSREKKRHKLLLFQMICLSSWPTEDWKVLIVYYFAGHIQFVPESYSDLSSIEVFISWHFCSP